ncbi:MAG TPA: ion channel [Steroidobacteraceae bacterium]|nr:ion channel [Steroidobacteraceae bacterium]
MAWALEAIAAILLAITLWDAFVTVFSTRGAGPLTRRWTHWIWRGLLRLHARRRVHRLLSLAGPAMLAGTIIGWYALLWLGWFIAFSAHAGSIVDGETRLPVGSLDVFYFVGTTISGLGYGDLIPAREPWTVLSSVATLSGTTILTVSLSYVVSVVAAAIERKNLAQGVFGIADSVGTFLGCLRSTRDRSALLDHVLRLCSAIDAHAHKHLSYPVLHFFHDPRPDRSPARAVLLLSDAFFVLDRAVREDRRPAPAVARIVDSSIENYASLARIGIATVEPDGIETAHLLTEARALPLPVVPEERLELALDDYRSRRAELVALCFEDGWPESRIAGARAVDIL